MRFQKLKFNVFNLPPDKEVLEAFPELSRMKVLANSKAPQKNLLIRYLIFMYDPESDLRKEIPELDKRKIRAAELAGFEKQSNYLTEIFELRDKTTLEFIFVLLTQVYHNRKYREWVTLSQELDEYTRLRMDPITTKKSKKGKEDESDVEEIDVFKAAELKSKLRSQCNDIHKQLDSIDKEIFGDNDDLKLIATRSRYLSPENFAGVIEAESRVNIGDAA